MATVDAIRSCVLTITVLVAYSNTGLSHIVVEPRTAEAVVGSATYFNCSTNVTSQEIHWFHYSIGSQTRNIVYGYNKFHTTYQSRFAVEKNDTTGVCNLIIKSVATGDAGQYECQDSFGGGAKRSAHLVVLVDDPVRQSNINLDKVIGPNSCGIPRDVVVLTCVAEYIGDDAPIMEWKMVGVNKSITDGVTRTTSNGRLSSNLTLQADAKINGSVYTCNTTRTKTSSNGCHFGSIKVVGTLADTVMVPCDTDADKCKPLRDALICILLIVFPIALFGFFVVGWCCSSRRFKRYIAQQLEGKNEAEVVTFMKLFQLPKWPKRPTKTDKENKSKGPSSSLPDDAAIPLSMGNLEEKNDEEEQRASVASASEKIPSSASEEKFQQGGETGDLASDAVALVGYSANTSADKAMNQNLVNNQATAKELERLHKKCHELEQSNKATKKKLEDKIRENEKLGEQNETIKQKDQMNEELSSRIQQLEQHLYPKENIEYSDEPKLVQTIITQTSEEDNKPSIVGIAILDNALLIMHQESPQFEVYDSRTFTLERSFYLQLLKDPWDIASCDRQKCLFVIGGIENRQANETLTPDPEGTETQKNRTMETESKDTKEAAKEDSQLIETLIPDPEGTDTKKKKVPTATLR